MLCIQPIAVINLCSILVIWKKFCHCFDILMKGNIFLPFFNGDNIIQDWDKTWNQGNIFWSKDIMFMKFHRWGQWYKKASNAQFFVILFFNSWKTMCQHKYLQSIKNILKEVDQVIWFFDVSYASDINII